MFKYLRLFLLELHKKKNRFFQKLDLYKNPHLSFIFVIFPDYKKKRLRFFDLFKVETTSNLLPETTLKV